MKKTLTRKQINTAWGLLDQDPDAYPDGLLSKVVTNRGVLEPKRQAFDRRLRDLVQEHGVVEDGEFVEATEEDTPIEQNLEVKVEPEFFDSLQDLQAEEVEVELATTDVETISEIDGVDPSSLEDLTKWSFMLNGSP